MKTQVIRLEPGEDIASAVDRIQHAQASRILLVWPHRKLIFNRKVDLIILQRRAEELGIQLAFVLRNPAIRRIAQEIGIPVFRSAIKAMRASWSVQSQDSAGDPFNRRNKGDLRLEGQRFKPSHHQWTNSTWIRYTLFSVSIAAVLAVIVLFIPTAQINVVNLPTFQEVRIPVMPSESETIVRLSGLLPAHSSSVVVEASASMPASGQISIPDKFATGLVQFTNLTDGTVTIPEGTVVSTIEYHPVKYRVVTSGNVPAGAGATVEISIQAVEAGTAGNQSAGRIQWVEGALSGKILVKNDTPISGGTVVNQTAPTTNDRDALKSSLLVHLTEQAKEQIAKDLRGEVQILESSLKLKKVYEETYTPAEAIPASELSLKMRAEFEAKYVNSQDLLSLAEGVLNARLEPGYTPKTDSLQQHPMTIPTISEGGSYTWEMLASRQVMRNVYQADIVRQASGARVIDVQKRFQSILGSSDQVQVRIAPTWWPWMPVFPFRISVQQVTGANSGS